MGTLNSKAAALLRIKTMGVALFTDIQQAFLEKGKDRLASRTLCHPLVPRKSVSFRLVCNDD